MGQKKKSNLLNILFRETVLAKVLNYYKRKKQIPIARKYVKSKIIFKYIC